MADKITINFAANTEDVEAGADRMKDSLKDTQGALDDVGQAGQDATAAASSGLDKTADSADNAAQKVGGPLVGAMHDFDGSAKGAAEGAVSALTGFANFIPGIGTLIGSALGTIAGSFIKQFDDAAKANEKRIADMYDDMIKSGQNFLSDDAISKGIHDIIEDDGKLAESQAAAAAAGANLADVIRAQAGDQYALTKVREAAKQTLSDLNAQQDTYIKKNGDSSAAIDDQISSVENVLGGLGQLNDQTDSAIGKAQLFKEATDDSATAVGNLTGKIQAVPHSVYASVDIDTTQAESKLDALVRKPRRVQLDAFVKYGVPNP